MRNRIIRPELLLFAVTRWILHWEPFSEDLCLWRWVVVVVFVELCESNGVFATLSQLSCTVYSWGEILPQELLSHLFRCPSWCADITVFIRLKNFSDSPFFWCSGTNGTLQQLWCARYENESVHCLHPVLFPSAAARNQVLVSDSCPEHRCLHAWSHAPIIEWLHRQKKWCACRCIYLCAQDTHVCVCARLCVSCCRLVKSNVHFVWAERTSCAMVCTPCSCHWSRRHRSGLSCLYESPGSHCASNYTEPGSVRCVRCEQATVCIESFRQPLRSAKPQHCGRDHLIDGSSMHVASQNSNVSRDRKKVTELSNSKFEELEEGHVSVGDQVSQQCRSCQSVKKRHSSHSVLMGNTFHRMFSQKQGKSENEPHSQSNVMHRFLCLSFHLRLRFYWKWKITSRNQSKYECWTDERRIFTQLSPDETLANHLEVQSDESGLITPTMCHAFATWSWSGAEIVSRHLK